MRVALAQLNPIIGDIAGNAELILGAVREAIAQEADVLLTGEMALIGYPPRDLLFREGVVAACEAALEQIVRQAAADAPGLTLVIGYPRLEPSGERPLRNSAAICRDGRIIATYDKRLLPGYDVFDEDRYFQPGDAPCTIEIAGRRAGIVICEDLWRATDVLAERHYDADPVPEMARGGCEVVLSLNASPFVLGKWHQHLAHLRRVAGGSQVPIVAVNQVGGNDDLVFDGRSVVVNRSGALVAALPGFEPAVQTVDVFAASPDQRTAALAEAYQVPARELFDALVAGVRDYCRKTGNNRVIMGLSGGIDSAVTAVIAARALGPENVLGVIMPSRYSSPVSAEDARALAENLGLPACPEASISAAHLSVHASLARHLRDRAAGVTDENIQARLRGLFLMAFSNARGGLVLSTSNKSEMATGYTTLYGDMCGALGVLGDVLKTQVYELARWMNGHHAALGMAGPPIPHRCLTRPPSAELRPNQTDQDTLPAYEVLDEIVTRVIDQDLSAERIARETGQDLAFIEQTMEMIDRAQYKRDQAAVVPKVSARAFGRGRPMPIVMKSTTMIADVPEAPALVGGKGHEGERLSD